MTAGDPEAREPIYVDLDGTLIATDMLWESICLLLRKRPVDALQLPLWLLAGKAGFKQRLATRVASDPTTLPYRREVIEYLEREQQRGREIVLATATHRQVADGIAAHLGFFCDVLATDEGTNLSGDTKLEQIQMHAESRPFEYLGNSSADLPVWERAHRVVLVSPSRAAARGAEQLDAPKHEIETVSLGWRPLFRALRIHQWSKNALLFVPLLLAHEIGDPARLLAVLVAFLCFSLIASATYLLNDLLDIEADRQHPRKSKRPFATGALPIPTGFALIAGLLLAGFGASLLLLPLAVTGMLLLYLISTAAYSFYFKEQLFLDVLLLAGLYTLRVLTGAAAGEVPVSPWLLAFSTFFFLGLALVKRYVELLSAKTQEREHLARRGYRVDDLSVVESMGITSGYLAVLVLCLYVSNDDVSRLYPNPNLLWLISPIMLYWITRMWFLARRGSLPDDPVLFAVTDGTSYAVAALVGIVGLLAAW